MLSIASVSHAAARRRRRRPSVASVMRATEKSERARSSPARPSASARSGSARRLERPAATAGDVSGLDEDPRLAVRDHLGHGAHPRRDDRQPREHRLEQDDPEALPARGVDEHVRPLEPVADLEPPGQHDGAVEPELAARGRGSPPRAARCRGSRAPRRDARRACGRRRAGASRGPSARSGDRSRARAAPSAGSRARPASRSDGACGSVVEAVVDRDAASRAGGRRARGSRAPRRRSR